eukprot:Lithocolla_globosa_v1_NODE_181_length_5436_cov_36.573128.p5 type:complete len:162 gc:universal NODE_181_length_5436_cov_36.573128:2732-3217(+)
MNQGDPIFPVLRIVPFTVSFAPSTMKVCQKRKCPLSFSSLNQTMCPWLQDRRHKSTELGTYPEPLLLSSFSNPFPSAKPGRPSGSTSTHARSGLDPVFSPFDPPYTPYLSTVLLNLAVIGSFLVVSVYIPPWPSAQARLNLLSLLSQYLRRVLEENPDLPI